ncbi:MAG TPA: hypothetical protein VI915_04730 [Thermoplasmata archaeon]|nr:hypothetical protein [Thermoplasmata archaeon]
MAIKDLIEQKEKIVREHVEALSQINNEILKLTGAAMRDTRTKAGGGLKVKGFLQGLLEFGRESELGMESGDRLEYAKLWFQNAENMRRTLGDDPGYASLLTNIDAQLDLYRRQLQRLDEDLRKAEGEKARRGVRDEQDRLRRAV